MPLPERPNLPEVPNRQLAGSQQAFSITTNDFLAALNPWAAWVEAVGDYLEGLSTGSIDWGDIGGTLADQTDLVAALDTKAPLASPTFTGAPTAPTAAGGTNTTQIATTAFVRGEIAGLVDSSPGALDTLNELAAALGDDPNFATTITTALGLKPPLDAPVFTASITASFLTASRLLAADGDKKIVSLDTATYPSLAELAHLKGVTSAIQTQIAAKQATIGGAALADVGTPAGDDLVLLQDASDGKALKTAAFSAFGGGSGPAVSSGAGAPSSTPAAIGDIYVDTTNFHVWQAKGTASSADWIPNSGWHQLGSAAGISGVTNVAFSSIPVWANDLLLVYENLSANTGTLLGAGIYDGASWHGATMGVTVPQSGGLTGALWLPNRRFDAGSCFNHAYPAATDPSFGENSAIYPFGAQWRCAGGVDGIRIILFGGPAFDSGDVHLFGRN